MRERSYFDKRSAALTVLRSRSACRSAWRSLGVGLALLLLLLPVLLLSSLAVAVRGPGFDSTSLQHINRRLTNGLFVSTASQVRVPKKIPSSRFRIELLAGFFGVGKLAGTELSPRHSSSVSPPMNRNRWRRQGCTGANCFFGRALPAPSRKMPPPLDKIVTSIFLFFTFSCPGNKKGRQKMKFSVGFGRSRNRNKVGKTLITFCHNKPNFFSYQCRVLSAEIWGRNLFLRTRKTFCKI